jgi:hypothetical protein
MVIRKSNRGQSIDMEALIAANGASPAVGNLKVNAAGDTLGPGGDIIQTNAERARAYYQDNPSSSTSQVSIKGGMPALQPDVDNPIEPKTAKTQKENVRKAEKKEPSVVETAQEILEDKLEAIAKPSPSEISQADLEPITEPEEFDEPTEVAPLGCKEVEQENGDIEMVPYYTEDDTDDTGNDD